MTVPKPPAWAGPLVFLTAQLSWAALGLISAPVWTPETLALGHLLLAAAAGAVIPLTGPGLWAFPVALLAALVSQMAVNWAPGAGAALVPGAAWPWTGAVGLAWALAALGARQRVSLLKRQEQARLEAESRRQADRLFLPTELLDLLRRDEEKAPARGDGVHKWATVMMVDLRGFTRMSQGMTPKQVLHLLNGWLDVCEPIVHRNRGFIEKFLGDGFIAVFNHTPEDALDAAVALNQALENFNRERGLQEAPPLAQGIGIHYGHAILGLVGDRTRLESTVVSDAVTVASDLERLTRFYDTPLLVSRETLFEALNPNQYDYRFLDTIQLKGRNEPVAVFEILSGQSGEGAQLKRQSKDRFEEALGLYLMGQIPESQKLFEEILELNPRDTSARIYLKRCHNLTRFGFADQAQLMRDFEGFL